MLELLAEYLWSLNPTTGGAIVEKHSAKACFIKNCDHLEYSALNRNGFSFLFVCCSSGCMEPALKRAPLEKLLQMHGSALKVLQWPQSCSPLGGSMCEDAPLQRWSHWERHLTGAEAELEGPNQQLEADWCLFNMNFKHQRMLVVTVWLCSSLIFSPCL